MSLGDQIKEQLIKNAAPRIFGNQTNVPSVNEQTPVQIIGGVLAFLLQLVGVIFLALLVWAGYKWMTAAGDTEKAGDAIGMAKNALFGFILAFVSFVIVEYLFIVLIPSLAQPTV